MISTNIMSVGDVVYGLFWYTLPLNEQFIVETIIRRSHKTYEVKGLGMFVCSLETYMKVNICFLLLLFFSKLSFYSALYLNL